jgi:Zn finger protein HypA/HybF involved in hydrogenase expression
MMARDYSDPTERRHAEEALDRKAKAGIQSNNYNCSIKAAKFHLNKKPLINEVACERCGKMFKTNRKTKLCFKCEKKAGNK